MTITTPSTATPNEVFAVDLSVLAREIAMDIFEIKDLLRVHQLTDEEWMQIQENPRFKLMLADMMREWNATTSTIDRVRIKAATGVESVIEIYIRAIADPTIPLNQRVEAGKFLARLGELDGNKPVIPGGGAGGGFSINIHFGGSDKPPVTIEGKRIPEVTDVD